ncbi:341_t:CDS:10 [Acaulospora colombiana]|uniref:341_t:CDS:1 n=1 Tax=Acaulospora colombiana TaxID=27376 RepID=A0ACA9K5D7_9GLOM|nr:341_t:CDS:10 [Acaulospora colombiana]
MILVSSIPRIVWGRQLFSKKSAAPFLTSKFLTCINLRALTTNYQNYAIPSKPSSQRNTKKKSSLPKKRGMVEGEPEKLDATDKVSKILLEELWTHKTLAGELSLKPPNPVGCWQDIEEYKPEVKTLDIEEYKNLHSRVSRGFLAGQVREFLKNHGQPSNRSKDAMVDDIIQKVWEFKIELVTIFIRRFPIDVRSKPIDIFFIVGPDGESLRWLESESNVKIHVDLSAVSYTISGTKRDISKAKEMITKLTTYTTMTVELPLHIGGGGDNKSLKELMPYVQDICRASGAFIELEDSSNRITISAQIENNIKEAKRLLSIAWMRAVTSEMDFNKLGHFLETYLNSRTPNSQLEIDSTFGHNIFHGKEKSIQNIFLPPLEGSYSREFIGKWYQTVNPTKLFLPSYPQPKLLESLDQLSRSQTTVQLNYLPHHLHPPHPINQTSNRLCFQFDVVNNNLRLKDFLIFRRRLLIDILMLNLPKDIRLLSSIKESLLGSHDVTHFVDQCKLYNSRDIQCPKEYVLERKCDGESTISIPYTLESARVYKNGYYDYNGFVLVVKKVIEQNANLVRPEVSDLI